MAIRSSNEGGFRFQYRKRDVEAFKKRSQERGGIRGETGFKKEFDIFQAKGGTNKLRILPPTWEDAKHYFYTIFIHSFIGPENSTFLCPYKMNDKAPCPCCEAWREAKDAGDDEEARQMSFKEESVGWAIDRDGDEEHPVIFRMSRKRDNELMVLAQDEDTGKVLWIDDPDAGYDFRFTRTGKGITTTYTGTKISRNPSPISDNPMIQRKVLKFVTENPIPDILVFSDYETIERALNGTAPAKDDDLDDDDDDKPKKVARKRVDDDEDEDDAPKAKAKRVSEPDDEDDDDDSPPKSKKRTTRDEDSDDDNDQDDDEDDDPPKSKGRRGRDADEDEDSDGDDDPPPKSKRKARDEDDDDSDDDDPPSKGRRPAKTGTARRR